MERIVPSQHHLHVFGSLISQPVDYFKHEAEVREMGEGRRGEDNEYMYMTKRGMRRIA